MDFFLNETSVPVFAKLAIFPSIYTRAGLGKIVRKFIR